MKRIESNKDKKRRYYLHKRLREIVKVDSAHRTVFLPTSSVGTLQAPYSDYCNELQKIGYNIQLVIN